MARSTPAALVTLALLLTPAQPAIAQRAAPDSARRLVDAAVRAMAAADFDAAVEAADLVIALAPERSAHQLVYGQAYLSHARDNPSLGAIGKVKRGRAAVERAIELEPGNLDARHTLMQFLLQAPGIAGGSREGALEQALEIERRDPIRGLLARAEVASFGDDPEALAAVFDDAAPLLGTPADSGARLMGVLLAAAATLEDADAGERLTEAVYAAHRSHPVARYHRARLWVIGGERLGDAERLLLDYLAGPERRAGAASRAGAHWRLAQLYERQDRDARAREQYRLAANLDPRLRRGSRSAERLEREV